MTDATSPLQGSTPAMHLASYRAVLKRYDPPKMLGIAEELGLLDSRKPSKVPERISDHWSEDHRSIERRLSLLPVESRQALTLFALLETSTIGSADLLRALRLMGVSIPTALDPLLRSAVLVIDPGQAEGTGTIDPDRYIKSEGLPYHFRIHPNVLGPLRTVLPNPALEPIEGNVRQARQCDSLEIVLRLAAVWQRVSEAPLRRTQQGSFFKRDRERLEDDPAIVGPISDAIEPMPDMAMLWVALGEAVGLIHAEADTDRMVAATPDYWADNAVHLPQMLATRWLGLTNWHEIGGSRIESAGPELSSMSLRLPLLLTLASVEPERWVTLSSIVDLFDQRRPTWAGEIWPLKLDSSETTLSQALIEAVLLGPAYQLGLIEAAEESTSGRRVVRLSALGRYSLAVGTPPEPGVPFEHFLYVQPNFEMIAYRQGLTPSIIGKFSRFARWSKLGAAIELKLTADSVYRGLEGGMTPDEMLALLRKHSSRVLAPSVEDSVRTWSGRRERVTYHASATLIEFATPEELETALADWPTGRETPVRVSPRLLLVDDVSSIPFQRFRQAGARDYRKPSEPCVDLGPEGVTLSIELGRSDLLVDAEIIRFADEQPTSRDTQVARRRFVVSRASLARAVEGGLTSPALARWYLTRTGEAMPAAVRLMLHAVDPEGQPIEAGHPRLLAAPTPELLDGLLQHPATRDAFLERVGPRHAIVSDHAWTQLQSSLTSLGLTLKDGLSPTGEVGSGGRIHDIDTGRQSAPRSAGRS